jgi:hypothetical protein
MRESNRLDWLTVMLGFDRSDGVGVERACEIQFAPGSPAERLALAERYADASWVGAQVAGRAMEIARSEGWRFTGWRYVDHPLSVQFRVMAERDLGAAAAACADLLHWVYEAFDLRLQVGVPLREAVGQTCAKLDENLAATRKIRAALASFGETAAEETAAEETASGPRPGP